MKKSTFIDTVFPELCGSWADIEKDIASAEAIAMDRAKTWDFIGVLSDKSILPKPWLEGLIPRDVLSSFGNVEMSQELLWARSEKARNPFQEIEDLLLEQDRIEKLSRSLDTNDPWQAALQWASKGIEDLWLPIKSQRDVFTEFAPKLGELNFSQIPTAQFEVVKRDALSEIDRILREKDAFEKEFRDKFKKADLQRKFLEEKVIPELREQKKRKEPSWVFLFVFGLMINLCSDLINPTIIKKISFFQKRVLQMFEERSSLSHFRTVVCACLNVRKIPNMKGQAISILNKGQKVTFLEKHGRWVKISFRLNGSDAIGWVFSKYLK